MEHLRCAVNIFPGCIKRTCIALLIVIIGSTAVHAQKEFDATQRWMQLSDAPNSLYHHIAGQAFNLLNKRTSEIAALNTLPQWQQRKLWIHKTLSRVVGPLPAKTPMNVRIIRTFEKDGYKVEHIVYESQPGYYVTSTLFLPGKSAGQGPAIIYCSGHSATGYRSYQNIILNLVKKGFIVFAFDPIGQGERLQYYNTDTGKSGLKGPTGEHSYAGAQLFLTGNTLARNFIWDGIRAVDYLLTRKEVDPARIGITGRSGGGTQTAYITAFDDRIAASAPENYITNFTRLFQSVGPQDAEQNFFNGISGGLDMADLLLAFAPKPILMITTSQDMFPIQGALETFREVSGMYKAYGKTENFIMVSDNAPHASTKKNREAMYAFFQNILKNPGDPKDEDVDLLSTAELQVTPTGQVSTSYKTESAYTLNRKEAELKMDQLDAARKDIPGYFPGILRSAMELSGYREPKDSGEPSLVGRIQREGYIIEKYHLKGEGNYIIPYILLKPEIPTPKAMIYLNPSGKSADVAEGGEMEWFAKNGITVLAPDIIGTGEMGPGVFKGDSNIDNVSYNVWFASMLIGRSIVGIQTGDVVRLINWLKKDSSIKEIYGLAKQQMAPVLLHAAAFHQEISKVALIEPYSSYRSIAMNPAYNPGFLQSTVPGSVGVYDLPDLEASLAPRKLLIAGITDGNGSNSNTTDIEKDMSFVQSVYHRRGPGKLQQVPAGSMDKLHEYFKIWIENSKK